MRHRCANRKLGRTSEHRIATLRNLATALIEHERITTTMGKAKELRPYAERLITKAQQDTVHARRIVARDLHDRDIVKRLFDEIAPRFSGRPGGYTRVLRTMPRRGDAAEMAIVELVVRKEKESRAADPPRRRKPGRKAGSPGSRSGSRAAARRRRPARSERPDTPLTWGRLRAALFLPIGARIRRRAGPRGRSRTKRRRKGPCRGGTTCARCSSSGRDRSSSVRPASSTTRGPRPARRCGRRGSRSSSSTPTRRRS